MLSKSLVYLISFAHSISAWQLIIEASASLFALARELSPSLISVGTQILRIKIFSRETPGGIPFLTYSSKTVINYTLFLRSAWKSKRPIAYLSAAATVSVTAVSIFAPV